MDGEVNPATNGAIGHAEADLDREVAAAMSGLSNADLYGDAANKPGQDDPHAPGSLVKGRVANVASNDILIDLGGKMLGVISRGEFDPAKPPPKVGDEIEALVDGLDARGGLLNLSYKKAAAAALWRDIQIGKVFECKVSGMNKGGLEVDLHGIRGFIPASQVDTHFLKDISELIGKTIRVEVTKFSRDDENLIVSRRKVLEREAVENRARYLADLKEGQSVRGKVRNVTDYGAFIELQPGVDGLLHVSDMSWGRVTKPGDVVSDGQELELSVLKINRETGKISLGLKQIKANPWETVSQRFEPQQKLQGRVARLADFGAFVELEEGVDGLIPISEMSWTRRLRHPSEVVKEGDIVTVVVLTVDQEKHRISLGLKQAEPNPWDNITERYPVNEMRPGKVARITEFGAFIELESGIDGLLHISEISDQRIKTVSEKLKVGDEVQVRVLKVDIDTKRISLSMKPLPPPPKPPTPEEIAAAAKAAAKAAKKKPAKPRRGGLEAGWMGAGLGGLDPSKFGS